VWVCVCADVSLLSELVSECVCVGLSYVTHFKCHGFGCILCFKSVKYTGKAVTVQMCVCVCVCVCVCECVSVCVCFRALYCSVAAAVAPNRQTARELLCSDWSKLIWQKPICPTVDTR